MPAVNVAVTAVVTNTTATAASVVAGTFAAVMLFLLLVINAHTDNVNCVDGSAISN